MEILLINHFSTDILIRKSKIREGDVLMSLIKERAVQMIDALPDDNVVFLVELMQRFMMPEETKTQDTISGTTTSHADFMQELETMRIKAKPYFPPNLEAERNLGGGHG